jgi:hypothetical protein
MASVNSAEPLHICAPTPPGESDDDWCAIGEVHTGLLQHSTALPASASARVLALVPGEHVRLFERPIQYALSPQLLTGLDCQLASRSGPVARAVGTVASQAAITGGHVLQGSSFARLRLGSARRWRRWSYYLSQPGILELTGRACAEDLGLGFVDGNPAFPGGVNPGAISGRLLDRVQAAGLDRKPPFRLARTQLRWTASVASTRQVHFTIENTSLRTLRLTVPRRDLAAVARFCEDVALHDWLLSCLMQIIERSRIGVGDPQRVTHRLRPVMDYLLHLWMPAARHDDALTPLWRSLDQRAGFSRQWEASVSRIRDQVSTSPGALLEPADDQGGSRR